MKPLLNKFLGGKEAKEQVKPQFPTPLTLNSLSDHQRVSVVGWIANKLGQQLAVEGCHEGLLVYRSLYSQSDGESQTDEGYLIYLAEQLVTWIELEEDVYFKIRQMPLEDQYHKGLLEVYEGIKNDANLYFNRKKGVEEQISEADKVWEVYRDVIHAASQRKLLLIRESELSSYKDGTILCDEPVVEKSDIPKARNIAKAALEKEGLSRNKVASCTLLISEAITNTLKHAKDGRLLIVKRNQALHLLIEDAGSGFPLKTLPYTLLTAGYSTKKSLGQGFTLMVKLANQVLLKTSSTGSTLVLVIHKEKSVSSEESA
ncbi:anti-sigma regulatory factor (Ser/Thr protein kinase) [Pullulanibacillus pueri]|uniref:Histidine kinase/HSP90-like ATPase domain-containing protein n=1 Tax=Pullulanibacillus pueri TaxID=1437324 RepID=A0A8J3EM04_9BACL|nr:ATP-binding protein [Pullulanibacillus pueri]MBM7682794.1 anti-sigma regulatory factor (Ser/Thr protein kinase) [Pullulanibacillus pueri]GGH83210.1 hypothetical protein GCM10007096_23740 [Pullulanibacillus pueri]